MPHPITKLEGSFPLESAGSEILKPTVIPLTPKDKFIRSAGPALPEKMMAAKGPTSILLRTFRGSMGAAKPAAPKPTVAHKPSPSAPAIPKESAEGPHGPMVLIPLSETPVEPIKPKESLHRPREKQKPMPTAEEALLKPDFLPADQPKEEKIGAHQPLSLEGGWQPKESEASPVKVRGEEQPFSTGGPILGEIPSSWIGGPGVGEVIQHHNRGIVVRTYTDEDGFVVTESKQPNDPTEPWLATMEIKPRIVDGVERKVAGQIKFDPAKLEEEAADALAPTDLSK